MAGSTISAWYDPMLAKLIVHAPTREAAIAAMQAALDESRIDGIETNLRWLREVVRNRGIRERRRFDPPARHHRLSPSQHPRDQRRHRDHGAGLAGPAGLVGHRRSAVRADGRPLVPASATVLLGNAEGTAGLEITVSGPDPALQRPGAHLPDGRRFRRDA